MDAIDVDRAAEFVLKCQNFDGGFGSRPGSESHAGQVARLAAILSCSTIVVILMILCLFVLLCVCKITQKVVDEISKIDS